jgi:regulator of protease activity HflC (stomatin/prohibitin superfamily)
MMIQPPASTENPATAPPPTEREAWSGIPGFVPAVFGWVALIASISLLVSGYTKSSGGGAAAGWGWLLLGIGALLLGGLVQVVAGEARVVQMFGQYRGTVRTAGLAYVNPLTKRRKVSTKLRNHETAVAKVNDADGNPIEIAAVVVWQVEDTAKALYAVDDYPQFVAFQAETAVRHIASSYPYTSHREGELSLRDNAEEITRRLSAELADRVRPAGVDIIESRLTRLSYAPEIAQAMLRQQQANAVVGARQRIVEGAVGMVELALQRLEEKGVIELDEERKAAMVSNLLVVLCSEQATQQVVNTGSLYQ